MLPMSRRLVGSFLVRSWQNNNNSFSEAVNISICNAENHDNRLPQICLGFSYNWHVLDKIGRHNRPRNKKNAFRGQINIQNYCRFKE